MAKTDFAKSEPDHDQTQAFQELRDRFRQELIQIRKKMAGKRLELRTLSEEEFQGLRRGRNSKTTLQALFLNGRERALGYQSEALKILRADQKEKLRWTGSDLGFRWLRWGRIRKDLQALFLDGRERALVYQVRGPNSAGTRKRNFLPEVTWVFAAMGSFHGAAEDSGWDLPELSAKLTLSLPSENSPSRPDPKPGTLGPKFFLLVRLQKAGSGP